MVTCVVRWSSSKNMVLNVDKSEMAFFVTDSHEANRKPTIDCSSAYRLHVVQHAVLKRIIYANVDRLKSV